LLTTDLLRTNRAIFTKIQYLFRYWRARPMGPAPTCGWGSREGKERSPSRLSQLAGTTVRRSALLVDDRRRRHHEGSVQGEVQYEQQEVL